MKKIQYTLREVDPSTLTQWIDDFRRDQNPDREISIWESIARAYQKYCSDKQLTLTAKQDVFKVLLMRSGASSDEVLNHIRLNVLTKKDAVNIMKMYNDAPEPIAIQPGL